MEDLLLPFFPPDLWAQVRSSSGSDVRAPPSHVLLDSWQDVQVALGTTSLATDAENLWKARHCQALTLVHGLLQLPEPHSLNGPNGGRGQNGRWLLWIVGAREAVEGELARQGLLVEVLNHLCPRKAGWELVLIGPEMRCWEMETSGSGLLRARNGALHCVLTERPDEKPDAAVLFNSGIGTLLWPLVNQWLPTVIRLLQLDVPLLCTCFNVCELEGERQVFEQTFGATALTEARPNPFSHPMPIAAFAPELLSTESVAELIVNKCIAANKEWEAGPKRFGPRGGRASPCTQGAHVLHRTRGVLHSSCSVQNWATRHHPHGSDADTSKPHDLLTTETTDY